jgi:hypothetical protein
VTGGRPEIGPALSAAWRHPRAAREELRVWQDARLRRLVAHAYESVPLYRKLFDLHRLHPRHIRGTADLELIPFTDKAEMRRQGPAGVLARGHDPERLLFDRLYDSERSLLLEGRNALYCRAQPGLAVPRRGVLL